MSSSPPLSIELLEAYRGSDYPVLGAVPFVLRVDVYSSELATEHALAGVNCSAFITAWNPYSQLLGVAENTARQQALVAELEALGLPWLPGEGRHPTLPWPAEASLLVLGLDRPRAEAMGRRYGQHAILFCAADAVPRLVCLGSQPVWLERSSRGKAGSRTDSSSLEDDSSAV